MESLSNNSALSLQAQPGYLALWEFHVKPEARAEFERAYGPEGDWAQLFGKSPDYRGTELLRDPSGSGRYLTLDRWASRDAFLQFKREFQSEYAALDRQCEALTERESLLGEFSVCSASVNAC